MIKLKNKYLTAKIDEKGCQIASLKEGEKEYIWQKDPKVWNSCGPVLFPFCGGLKDDKFIYEGVEYPSLRHGFAKTKEFDVKLLSRSSVTLSLVSDEETLKIYPFDFELNVTFTLLKKQMIVKYRVKNTGNKDMYFSIGSHEAYACEGGVENYDVIFPRKETLESVVVVDGLLSGEKKPIIKSSGVLPIYESYFDNDSLVFKDMASRKVILRNRITGDRIGLDFPGADYFVIWHIKGAPYICLEPWAGIGDGHGFQGEISEREGIITLKKNRTYCKVHKISVLPTY